MGNDLKGWCYKTECWNANHMRCIPEILYIMLCHPEHSIPKSFFSYFFSWWSFLLLFYFFVWKLSRREWGDSQELLDMVIRWNKIKALVLNCGCCFSSVIYFLDGHENKMPRVYCFVALCYVSLLRDSMCRNCLAFVLMYKLLPLLDVARAKLP